MATGHEDAVYFFIHTHAAFCLFFFLFLFSDRNTFLFFIRRINWNILHHPKTLLLRWRLLLLLPFVLIDLIATTSTELGIWFLSLTAIVTHKWLVTTLYLLYSYHRQSISCCVNVFARLSPYFFAHLMILLVIFAQKNIVILHFKKLL